MSCPRCTPPAHRYHCPVSAARRPLAAALVLSPLRAARSPPPLSCLRCAPSARHRPCPVPAAHCPLAAALVLSLLRADRSPTPLSCLRCVLSARCRPCPVPAVRCPLAAVPVLVLSATGSPPDSAPSHSPSYLPRPTHYRPRCLLLAIVLATSYLLPYSSRLTRSDTRHVLLAIVHAAGVLVAILLTVVVLIVSCSSRRAHHVGLIASCRICQLSFVSDTHSKATRIKNSGDGCDARCLCWKREVW